MTRTRSCPKKMRMKASDYFALLRLRSELTKFDSDAARKVIEAINRKINLKNF